MAPDGRDACEVNFDGLIGPTHNYAGLSHGNVASAAHRGLVSNPRAAAKQGLDKMRQLMGLGLVQGVLPPQERPHVPTLRRLGFTGTDAEIVAQAGKEAPAILAMASSASAMWTANAATVTPSADSADGRLHLTVANLSTNGHRAIEPPTTARILRAIFADETLFAVHAALPPSPHLGDEGAANHTRLCADYGTPGVEVFVYGRAAYGPAPAPTAFPARQTLEASAAVARLNTLPDARTVMVQQAGRAIDAGVFHNDVIAVGNGPVLFAHEAAFEDRSGSWRRIAAACAAQGFEAALVEVPEAEVTLADAVASYLFNAQLVSPPGRDGMTLIVPAECAETATVAAYLDRLTASNGPIRDVVIADLRQSMRNGGGPACLRLRVAMTAAERAALTPRVLLDEDLVDRLASWVDAHYRDRLAPEDLADPLLLDESRRALEALTGLLGLGSLYDFQR